MWPGAAISASTYPMVMIAEYASADLWSNSAAGVTPIVYGANNSPDTYMGIRTPFIKNATGNLVAPYSQQLRSLAGAGVWRDVSAGLDSYALDASGSKIIPIFPIDVKLSATSGDVFCYAGRLKELFATMATLAVGDTFVVGADTYVVIPTGYYKNNLTNYSIGGKLCAKVQ